MSSAVIALISDLGTKDYFVGAMKGAILSINPDAKIVDITHDIPKHDVQTAAFVLAQAAETFPSDSIFVAVVDPGVGSTRKCILLRAGNGQRFIGPDNGIFTLVAERFGVSDIREVANRALTRPQVSPTFHGRDVMAPVAAYLSKGIEPAEVGPRVETFVRLEIQTPKLAGGKIRGIVLNVDDFGNIVTNIGAELVTRIAAIGDTLKVKIGRRVLYAKLVRTFADVRAGENLCYLGSAGFLEIAQNRENLARRLKVKVGTGIYIWK
jgi:hypothetical protein